MEALWKTDYKKSQNSTVSEKRSRTNKRRNSDGEDSLSRDLFNGFGMWVPDSNEEDNADAEDDELAVYLEIKKLKTKGLPVRAWWYDMRQQFPKLSKMVLDCLAIPAMSAEVERVFSRYERSVFLISSRFFSNDNLAQNRL